MKGKQEIRALNEDDLTPVWRIDCYFCGHESEISGCEDVTKAIKFFEGEGWQIVESIEAGEIGIWCGECNIEGEDEDAF